LVELIGKTLCVLVIATATGAPLHKKHRYLHKLKLQKIVTYVMNIKKLVGINSRLAKRHQLLVAEYLNATDTLSARIRALPDKNTSFASTQAAWCFYKNASDSLTKLHWPLLIAAQEGLVTYCSE